VPGRLKTYGYINAKIRSRLSELLSDRDFSEMLKAPGADEAVQVLAESAYAEELSSYAVTGDVRAVEFALTVHEMRVLRDLVKDLPGRAGSFTETLLLRHEVDMLKNALRLWFERYMRGRNISGGSSYLYTERIVHDVPYDAVVDADSPGAVLEVLQGTPYAEVIEPHVAEIESDGHLFPLEIGLDCFYFSRLVEQAESLPQKDREIALRVIGVEVDLLNIDRVVRFVSYYRKQERNRWDLFLPGGRIDDQTLKKAYAQDEAEDALLTLLADRYGEYRSFAEQHKSNPFDRLQMVEDLLRRILYDEVKRLLWGYPFTVGTVLAYIFLKRKEVRSVVRLLNAKQYGLSEERIRESL
jgi:V/A-type H+-transporting ATPase subunit C